MDILYIGKYPPIQGGESTKAYWLLSALVERGNTVRVISNPRDVGRENCHSMAPNDSNQLVADGLEYYQTGIGEDPFFIPEYSLVSERLASLALEKVDRREPDIIFGWYLFPYASAASHVAKMCDIPLVVQHAGSDLKRQLCDSRQFEYGRRVFLSADAVLSYPSSVDVFESLGCNDILKHNPSKPSIFDPDGPVEDLSDINGNHIDISESFLFFGKLTKGKGVGLLIEIASYINSDINVVLVSTGRHREYYKKYSKEIGAESVRFAEAISPWRVPAVMRNAQVVVVPEWNFGVEKHKSTIPIESVLCGTPVLLSKQIQHKYPVIDGAIETFNPTDEEGSANKFENISGYGKLERKAKIKSREARNKMGHFYDYVMEMGEKISSVI